MADGLTVGAAAILGGVFLGSVAVYTVSKCRKTSLTACIKRTTATVARKTFETASEAKRAFSEGFARGYCGDKKTPATETEASTAGAGKFAI